jgi:hypothetical protein
LLFFFLERPFTNEKIAFKAVVLFLLTSAGTVTALLTRALVIPLILTFLKSFKGLA